METLKLKHTAYHEAGHAVAHLRLNVQQGNVTIKPHDGNLGSSAAEGKEHVWSAEEAPNQVLCYCAGYAALIAIGCSEDDAVLGADNDFENAAELIETWSLSVSLDDWRTQSVELMSRPENIRAVDFVANALMKYETLDSDYLDILSDLADGNISEEEWQQFISWRHPEMLTQESE